MTKTYLAIAFLITGFLVGDAYGEAIEVYYCAETAAAGFSYDIKKGLFKPTIATGQKFKMKLDRDNLKTLELVDENRPVELLDVVRNIYTCHSPYSGGVGVLTDLLSCFNGTSHFNFNTANGKFTRMEGFGYISYKKSI